MKIIRAIFETGFCDGDGSHEQFYFFDDNRDQRYIDDIIRQDAEEWFADHEYLGMQWEYEDEEEEESDREYYYECCSYEWEPSTEEERQRCIYNYGCDETQDYRVNK